MGITYRGTNLGRKMSSRSTLRRHTHGLSVQVHEEEECHLIRTERPYRNCGDTTPLKRIPPSSLGPTPGARQNQDEGGKRGRGGHPQVEGAAHGRRQKGGRDDGRSHSRGQGGEMPCRKEEISARMEARRGTRVRRRNTTA